MIGKIKNVVGRLASELLQNVPEGTIILISVRKGGVKFHVLANGEKRILTGNVNIKRAKTLEERAKGKWGID